MFNRLLMLVGFLVLVLAVAAGGAYYFGWLNIATAHSPDKSVSEMSVSVDREKMRQDSTRVVDKVKQEAGVVAEKTRAATERVKQSSPTARENVLKGVLKDVNASEKSFRLTTGTDDVLNVQTTVSTTITINGQDSRVTDLKSGDSVTATLKSKNAPLTATTVTAERQ